MKASIIIVTRNRAEDLRQTLEAMRQVHVPDGFQAELLVVDNGSTDHTAQVASSVPIPQLQVRYELEKEPGQCRGRNRGLACAKGDIILFTDDDVRPPADWLPGMCDPIIGGKADAVAGGVRIAPHLIRPWMTRTHRSWLASSEWLEPGSPKSMVGANMAFSREVLRRIPGFDVEVGPGASGFGDDGLFASQLLAAGYRIHDGMDVSIEHHFEPSRLKRESWLNAARRRGESLAYLGHHWEHWGYRWGRPRLLVASLKLSAWRSKHRHEIREEGCSEEEMGLVQHCAMIHRHVREHGRPRKYHKHGLVKLR